MSLIPTSIKSSIGSTLLHLCFTSKAIWQRLEHICSGTENVTRVYEVCTHNTLGANRELKVYRNIILASWENEKLV